MPQPVLLPVCRQARLHPPRRPKLVPIENPATPNLYYNSKTCNTDQCNVTLQPSVRIQISQRVIILFGRRYVFIFIVFTDRYVVAA